MVAQSVYISATITTANGLEVISWDLVAGEDMLRQKADYRECHRSLVTTLSLQLTMIARARTEQSWTEAIITLSVNFSLCFQLKVKGSNYHAF